MLNQKSIDLIKSFEGCHLACYHLGDGVCTIGYGHTRPLAQCSCAGSWKISQQQAEGFLQNDLAKYRNAVMGYFTRNLNENQIGALTSFCYNLGTGIFAQYNFPKNGSDSAITSQMMLFLNKGTPFEAGITRRRHAETALFLAKEITNQNSAAPASTPKESKEEELMKIIKLQNNATYYLVRSTGVTSLTAQEWIGVKRVLGFKDSDVDTVNQAEFDGIKSALGKK